MKNNLSKQVGVYRQPNTTKHPTAKRGPNRILIPDGKRFGSLVLIENRLSVAYGRRTFSAGRFRCDCGNELVRAFHSLLRGKHPSCGCQGHKTRKEQHSLIPVGTKCRDWTVIENGLYQTHRTTVVRACRVRCICGTIAIRCSAKLTRGDTRSCGCVRNGHSIERLWSSLYREFSRRGREVHLTLAEFRFLAQQPCAYCGLEPSNIHKYRLDDPATSMRVLWTGLDRVDSNKDYVHGNVVPCCASCNRLKNDASAEDFFAHLGRIRSYNSSAETIHQIASSCIQLSC
jgi:hypothetical protein